MLVLNRSPSENLASAFSGSGTLRKEGTNTLTMTGNNTAFGGAVVVAGGTLKLSNANALGTSTGGTDVLSDATLDINGVALTDEVVTIQGNGIGGIGALYNSGTADTVVSHVVLSGDTTISSAAAHGYNIGAKAGPGVFDIGTFNGNNHDLSVIVNHEIDIKNVGDMGVYNINIAGPAPFYIAGNTTLGSTGYNLTLTNGRLGFYGGGGSSPNGADVAIGTIEKPLIIGGSGEIEINQGNMTIDSPVTLNGNLSVEVIHRQGDESISPQLSTAN